MATVARSTNKILWGQPHLLLADYGSAAVEEVGYSLNPFTLTGSKEVAKAEVNEVTGAVLAKVMSEGMVVSGELAQFDVDILARVMGLTKSGSRLRMGGEPENNYVALRAVATTADGLAVHVSMPKAMATEALKLTAQKKELSAIPFAFEGFNDGTTLMDMIFSLASADVTLSTGAFARTNATPTTSITHCKMSGEGAAADTLTDITGATALVDGEIIRLQIKTTAQPITIDHAAGIIELKDSTDWAMTKLAQWIDLYYDLANTTWKEFCRYTA